MPKTNIPNYRPHKATGQAFIELDGRRFYLGKHGSKASREEYKRRLAEYLANGKKLPLVRAKTGISCQELAVHFLEWAEGYYVKNKKPTGTFAFCQKAISLLAKHYGNESVDNFSPLSLVFLQEAWVTRGLARQTVNRNVRAYSELVWNFRHTEPQPEGCDYASHKAWCATSRLRLCSSTTSNHFLIRSNVIKQAFKHGVKFGWVEANTLYALQAVDNLKEGRTTAPEYRNIKPVADEIVEKTLPFLPPIVADMVRVQRFCGMRPQDVRNLRFCDIDRSGDVWIYRPFTHKTEHKKKKRIIAIGPRAQAILLSYLLEKEDTPEAFLISPKDTIRLQKIEKRQNRKTFNKQGRVQPSQRDRSKPDAVKKPGEQYMRDSYNRAIGRACKKAGVPVWTPNQLRHSAATEIRDKYGLEYTQVYLGHAHASTTEIYAEVDFEKAAKVAREIG
jgi:integrase